MSNKRVLQFTVTTDHEGVTAWAISTALAEYAVANRDGTVAPYVRWQSKAAPGVTIAWHEPDVAVWA